MKGEAAMKAAIGHHQPRDNKPTNGCLRSEYFDLFRAWLANPLREGSIAPSSNQLALAITKEISAATGPVLELGPGTGVFTRALLARGVAEENIVLVESGVEFTGKLRQQDGQGTTHPHQP
jgi:phosphatidylethanolamine/phosphatidyl-N-methylethanolamine N-methyltransferase